MTHSTDHNNWFLKYRLYHIPFWILYNYIWWAITIGHPVEALREILFTAFGVKFSFYVFFQIIAVYFSLYYLMPQLLQKRKFILYISGLLVTILISSFLIIPGYYLSAHIYGKTVQQIYGQNACWYHFLGNALSSTLGSMTLAMSVQLAWNWIQAQKREQDLVKEKLETELNFLKYQFNPHFLFNTINSIFFLIHKNPDKASASLAKFSELLRYQLYECDDQQIPLNSEITYLENFIELEKLRQNNNIEISLDLCKSSNISQTIAPFILLTFVENAFKHVSRNTGKKNYITIQLCADWNQLTFKVSNSFSDQAYPDLVHYGGIGLKNVQRRLDLVYSGQYNLEIQKSATDFEISLQLALPGHVAQKSLQQTA